VLNEARAVEGLVADIAAQDFAGELEVLVIDSGSSDGSIERLLAAAEHAGLDVAVVDNPAGTVPPGLNLAIARAGGDLIVRLDCKARYPSDYVRLCATAAEETGAWNVGGVIVPEGRTIAQRAVACAMDSPFGGIAWTRHAANAERIQVDTVYCGAYRPEVFNRIGLFDEAIPGAHEDEFNFRLRRAGGEIVLDPAIRAYYAPRDSLREVFSQYYGYGRWKVPAMVKHRRVLSGRSLAPLAFVASVGLLAVPATRAGGARRLLGAELAVYAALTVGFGADAVGRRGESWRLLPRVLAVFPTFHLGYGLGMLHGWLRAGLPASETKAGA
jgi:succinoglycan biosynthesis protein ExoA